MDATTTAYVGAPHFPPSNPASVEILRTSPSQPHDRLGEVVVDASIQPAPPVTEVEQKLREEAARIGADAAVVVYDRVQPAGLYVTGGWWNQSVETFSERKLVGVAIRYRPQSQ